MIQLPSPKGGTARSTAPHFWPMSIVPKWMDQDMPLGVEVGLDPSEIVFGGVPAPPPKRGQSPQFSVHVYCGQMAAWIKMPLGMEVGLGPGNIV